MNWIEQAPIWLIGLAMMTALVLAHEIGLQLGRRFSPKTSGPDSKGYLVSSALTLLGLITAFAFGQAQERWHSRQQLLVAEAHAVGTTYRHFEILDEPWRSALAGALREYAALRLKAADIHDPAQAEANARAETQVRNHIWAELGAFTRSNSVPSLNSALLQSASDLFDLASARRAADETRVPLAVLRLLVFSCVVVAAVIGYARAWETRSVSLFAGVILLLTLALCTILDLDRPSAGSVKVSQAAMAREFENLSQPEPTPREQRR